MTPLTHAAVGVVIFQKFRHSRVRLFGWAAAFALAFVSHPFLDAIPHFEDTGPLSDYRHSLPVFLALGAIGSSLSFVLMRWNREAGWVWLVLSLWIGLGSDFYEEWRIPTAIVALAVLAWKSRYPAAVGYLLAGMLATAADLLPLHVVSVERWHRSMHYQVDWGTHLFRYFSDAALPADWLARLRDPYFLVGYGLELLVEGAILLVCLYVFSRPRLEWQRQDVLEHEIRPPAEAAGKM